MSCIIDLLSPGNYVLYIIGTIFYIVFVAEIRAVAVDSSHDIIFWSDIHRNTISRTSHGGSANNGRVDVRGKLNVLLKN